FACPCTAFESYVMPPNSRLINSQGATHPCSTTHDAVSCCDTVFSVTAWETATNAVRFRCILSTVDRYAVYLHYDVLDAARVSPRIGLYSEFVSIKIGARCVLVPHRQLKGVIVRRQRRGSLHRGQNVAEPIAKIVDRMCVRKPITIWRIPSR